MKKSTFKKRIMATITAMFMAVSMVCVKADAASVETDTISTQVACNLYVRESGNENVLGIMRLSKDSSGVYNVFTASKACGRTTVRVSDKNAMYVTSQKGYLYANQMVEVSKEVKNPTYAYGSCMVSY